MNAGFEHSAAVNFASVLEDTVYQLSILGSILPVSFQARSDAKQLVGGNISSALESQQNLELKLEQNLIDHLDSKTIGGLVTSNKLVDQSMRQSPLTKDNLFKVQEDRKFCEDILVELKDNFLSSRPRHDFSSLKRAVQTEKEKKLSLQNTIIKEEQGRRNIKQLQRELLDIKKEKELQIQQRNEMIAHLKDQLQEMKAKSNMEGKYVKKNAENQVHQNQQRCMLNEQSTKEHVENLRRSIDEEVKTHVEVEDYLKKHQKILEDKVEDWMEKYDKDTEAKAHELNVLKTSKANDLERLQELTRKYAEYEQVVVEDRIEKEKERRKREQEEIELLSAVRLQSWWRGTMVTKQIGPFSKKKKKGGKKGKKGGKKGKKK